MKNKVLKNNTTKNDAKIALQTKNNMVKTKKELKNTEHDYIKTISQAKKTISQTKKQPYRCLQTVRKSINKYHCQYETQNINQYKTQFQPVDYEVMVVEP